MPGRVHIRIVLLLTIVGVALTVGFLHIRRGDLEDISRLIHQSGLTRLDLLEHIIAQESSGLRSFVERQSETSLAQRLNARPVRSLLREYRERAEAAGVRATWLCNPEFAVVAATDPTIAGVPFDQPEFRAALQRAGKVPLYVRSSVGILEIAAAPINVDFKPRSL